MSVLGAISTRCDLVSLGGSPARPVVFRQAEASDAGRLYEICEPMMRDGALLTRDRDFFAASHESLWVLEVDGVVEAVIGISELGELAEFFNVCVQRERHGLGLGRLLLAHALSLAVCHWGCKGVVLFTRTAERWFSRYGFERASPRVLPQQRRALIDEARGSVLLARRATGLGDVFDVLAAMKDIHVRFSTAARDLRWDPAADSLLMFAKDNDVDVESLCWSGVCGTCSVPLRSGTVRYVYEPIADHPEGEILLCLASPVTNVVIDE